MPIKEATRVAGGAYIPLHDLGRPKDEDGNPRAGQYAKAPDDGTLAVFRIAALEDEDCPPTKNEKGWDMPLLADVLVIHQDEDGNATGHEVWLRQRIRFAPVYVLRGHPKPKAEVRMRELPDPVNEVGDEIITRIQTKQGGEKGWVALQVPTAKEKKVALAVREELGGEDWGLDDGDPF